MGTRESHLRLPWEAHPEGGFIAYPEGRQHPNRYARMQRWATGQAGSWQWWTNYEGSSISDIADSKQAASDAANRAWPKVIEKARAADRRLTWEATQIEMIARAERGEIHPAYFANANADYENMMWIMTRIKPRPGMAAISAGLQRLVDALSAEFARRRRK